MKYLLAVIAIPLWQYADCNKKKANVETAAPTCIMSKVERPKQSLDHVPVQIDEYLYKEKIVFLLTAPCCDQHNLLYDEHCNLLCAPSGGYTGKGDGKCADFKDAKFVRLVWKKE